MENRTEFTVDPDSNQLHYVTVPLAMLRSLRAGVEAECRQAALAHDPVSALLLWLLCARSTAVPSVQVVENPMELGDR